MKSIATWSKRTFFFIGTNILVTSTLFFVGSFLMAHFEIELEGFSIYVILYSIIGMGGSFVSLWMSKWLAIRSMKIQMVSERTSDPKLRDLVQKVHHLSSKAGLTVKPAVGIYESAEVNAFATGPSKKNSLVAVSTGLLNHMNEHEIEGVLAHEVAHIANGDMVTMSLIQGVVNVMVYLIAHLLAQVVTSYILRDRRNWFIEYMVRQVFASLLYIPGSMLVCFFSRWREFRADKGGADFAGRDKMLSALQSLSQITQMHSQKKSEYNYLMINNASKQSLMLRLFSTHPPIEARMRRLQRGVL